MLVEVRRLGYNTTKEKGGEQKCEKKKIRGCKKLIPSISVFPQLPHIEIASITFVSRELTVLHVNKNISASIRTMPCLLDVFLRGF